MIWTAIGGVIVGAGLAVICGEADRRHLRRLNRMLVHDRDAARAQRDAYLSQATAATVAAVLPPDQRDWVLRRDMVRLAHQLEVSEAARAALVEQIKSMQKHPSAGSA